MQQKKQVYNFDFMRGLSIIILPKNRKMNFVSIGVNVQNQVTTKARRRSKSRKTSQPRRLSLQLHTRKLRRMESKKNHLPLDLFQPKISPTLSFSVMY